jgi:hypothetical protein
VSYEVQDFLKLVILRHYVYILLCILGHLLAGREREAGIAREQKPVVFVLPGLGTIQHFGEHTTEGPDVNSLVVVLLDHNDLRWPVPS